MPPVVPSALDYLAAEIRVELFVKVCADWRAIAMREETFDSKGQEEIDIYDIKCKEWGFLLKKLFGIHLGTGDYGHLVIDHSAMLLRQFHSFYHYSGQGLESSHKLHRQLYARATNHDASGPGQSLEQILTHWYSTHLLHLRYMFSEAKKCIESGKKKFHFRGCGWPANASCTWSTEDKQWITVMGELFCNTFGEDFLEYKYDPVKGTSVAEHITNNLVSYNRDTWERDYLEKIKKEQAVNCSGTPPSTPTQPVSVSHGPTMPTPPDSTGTSPTSPETPPSTPTQPVSVSHGPTMPTPPDSTGRSPTSPGTPLSSQKSVKDAMTHLSQFTRWELASLYDKIPKVGTTRISNMQVLYGSFIETDPFVLHTRPGDQIISDASSMLHQNAKQKPMGIFINGYGKFSPEGLAIFRKFSFLSDIKMRVSSEVKWLERNNCLTANEMDKVKKALWRTKHSQPIIRFERKSIDPMNYSDVIGERYIDNFTIDICIGKYIEEVSNKGRYDTLYLPSEFFCWMASNDKSLKLQKLSERLSLPSSSSNFTQILVPIHFDQASHWGLLYIDLPSNQIMFDDGMKFSLPLGKLPKVKEALYLLLELCPSNKLLETKFWETTTLQRFGMPRQAGNGSPIGGGSCGVVVILAARDFVMYGVSSANNIKWTFNEMNVHRARLLAKIASGW